MKTKRPLKGLVILGCFVSFCAAIAQSDTPYTKPKNWGEPIFEELFDNNEVYKDRWISAHEKIRWPQQQRFSEDRTRLGDYDKLEMHAKLNTDSTVINERNKMAPLTSGEVISKKQFLYGYFEARIKLPKGLGVFPAFWLFNKDWKLNEDYPREIDIIEQRTAVNQKDGSITYINTFNHFWENDKYFKNPKNESRAKHAIYANTRNYDGWYRIGFEWSETSLKWYIYDSLVAEVERKNIDKIANSPMNIYLSLQFLFDHTFKEATIPEFDPATVESQVMKVDWVKVWKRKK